jgi:RNA polymerase sigma-70 factor (ECF subfamily)
MTDLAQPTDVPPRFDYVALFEAHRRPLTGYCYRMLGSIHEAEDAVQESMVRAWRSVDRLDGPDSVKPWLYRIATNVCLTMLGGRRRRALPMDLVEASSGDTKTGVPLAESTWVQPVPDARVMAPGDDPAERTVARESIRLAFVAALQYLPARQRAVLILRDVLRWRAAEVAELLDTTVVSVNSALRRARVAIAERASAPAPAVADADQEVLLERYIDAFERFDVERLVALLHEDVVLAMPPHDMWLQGHDAIRRFFAADPGCRMHRFAVTTANAAPAVGAYRPTGPDGEYEAFALQVLEMSAGRITAIHAFLDPTLFPLFDLPASLPTAPWIRRKVD